LTAVRQERRNLDRRSDAQCRVVDWVCNHPDGSTSTEAANAARIPAEGATRVFRRMASRCLIHCDETSRWKADVVLLAAPTLRRVEST